MNQLRLIHENTIRKLSFKNIEAFVRALEEIILFIYKESTARYHPLFYPYMEVFIKELRKVANSEIKTLSFEEINSYFHFFTKVISSATVPFEGTPLRGLQILGALETRNIRFRRVIFLDLNEGVFPDLTEDYILPYQVRKALGMPVYQDRERLLYYYFNVLTGGASEVHLFYVKDDEKERSRFLERLLWEMEKSGRMVSEETVNYRVELSTPRPPEIKKTDEHVKLLAGLSISASGLDDYLRCGLKFYYNYVLGIKRHEALSADPESFDVGTIVHDSLNRYFKKRINNVLHYSYFRHQEDMSLKEIEDIVIDIFNKRYGNVSGRLYLLRHQIIRRLKEFLEYFIEEFSQKTIVSVEEDIEEQLYDSWVRGRIDLALKDQGTIYIIDYKTSSDDKNLKINIDKLDLSKRETWPEAIKSLQIPLYMILYSKRYNLPLSEINGYYYLLGKAGLNDIKYSPFKPEDKEGLSRVIEVLLREIKDPEVPFMPPQKLKDSCPSCDYKPLCGTEWVKGFEY